MRVGETASRLIELKGGHTKVEEHSVDVRNGESVKHRGQFVVNGVDDYYAIAERCQPLASTLQRLGISVKTDQSDLRASSLLGFCVAAQADGRVDDDRTGVVQRRGQQVNDAVEQDRHMRKSVHGSVRRPGRRPTRVAPTVTCTVSTHGCPVLLWCSCRPYGQVTARSPDGALSLAPGKWRQECADRRGGPEASTYGSVQKMPGSTSSETSANSGSFSAWYASQAVASQISTRVMAPTTVQ